jgi:hypothetical protein
MLWVKIVDSTDEALAAFLAENDPLGKYGTNVLQLSREQIDALLLGKSIVFLDGEGEEFTTVIRMTKGE